jgi:alpha-tubulin suppressor-like RCC1 family protein
MVPAVIVAVILCLPLQAANVTVTKVAAGGNNSVFLKSDGTLWGMGLELFGELGDGTTNLTVPIPEEILAGGVKAFDSSESTLFVKSDGSLWGMGWNQYGQLGDGTTNSPVMTPELIVASNVTVVASGSCSLFLKSDGSLWAMGNNEFGQLGDGTTNYPVTIPELIVASNVTSIAAGGTCCLFTKSDGSLWGMGIVEGGTITGQPPGWFSLSQDDLTPGQVESGNVTGMAIGANHILFLKSDGSLWGKASASTVEGGAIGVVPTNYATGTTVEIVSSNVTAVAAGGFYSLFLKSDGSLWGMGDNSTGELGVGEVPGLHNPQQIVSSSVTAIAAREFTSVFLKSDGTLWGMGGNYYGQLGDGNFSTNVLTPELIVGPPTLAGARLSGGSVLLSASNGMAGATYYLKTTVNPMLPVSQWTAIATNTLPVAGNFSFTNAVNSNVPQAFYVLQMQ